MRGDRVLVVFERELMTRLKTKGFWIATAVIPLFLIAISTLTTIVAEKQQGTLRLGVQDRTERVFPRLALTLEKINEEKTVMPITVTELPLSASIDSLDALVDADDVDAYILIDDEAIDSGKLVYRSNVTTNFIHQEQLTRLLQPVFMADRLQQKGYDAEEVLRMATPISLGVSGVGAAEAATAGEARVIITWGLFFLLYTILLIHGQAILRSVLEEKSSRIVEVVISSLRPSELLVGKVLGVGASGLLQVLIWIGTALLASRATDLGLPISLDALATLPLSVLVHFVFLFLMGFLLYAVVYATVGAMHNNEQEAQQMNMVVMVPIIASVVMLFAIINNPTSSFAVIVSLIPPLTPLLMMARIGVGAAPAWQVALGYLLLAVTIALEVVVAARIYRIGILMYGKRPTLGEIARWIRY